MLKINVQYIAPSVSSVCSSLHSSAAGYYTVVETRNLIVYILQIFITCIIYNFIITFNTLAMCAEYVHMRANLLCLRTIRGLSKSEREWLL